MCASLKRVRKAHSITCHVRDGNAASCGGDAMVRMRTAFTRGSKGRNGFCTNAMSAQFFSLEHDAEGGFRQFGFMAIL